MVATKSGGMCFGSNFSPIFARLAAAASQKISNFWELKTGRTIVERSKTKMILSFSFDQFFGEIDQKTSSTCSVCKSEKTKLKF